MEAEANFIVLDTRSLPSGSTRVILLESEVKYIDLALVAGYLLDGVDASEKASAAIRLVSGLEPESA